MRYIALNATKPVTTEKDVKRKYVLSILSYCFYLVCLIYLCIVFYTMCHLFMYYIMSHVFVVSLVLTHFLTLGRMEHHNPLLEEEYDKDHRARYIKEGQVT
jgi:hypothetical protein